MNINYFDALSRAWNRMVTALFRPFDLGKWFVIGFTAFLAGLLDSPGGGGGGGSRHRLHRHDDFGDVLALPGIAWDWLMDHPGWFTLIILGIFFLIVLLIVLTWLSSRGKFMFLDNVVHNRAKVTQPWHEFRKQGNSLFLWRLGFGLVILAGIILFLIQLFYIASDIYDDGFSPSLIAPILGIGLLFLFFIILIAFISAFLNNFVVPIMYKNRIVTTQAWHRFLSIFSQRWGYFLLYGIFLLVLYIVMVIGIIIAGLMTCCIGFLLLIIPYIGSVVSLPISYTFMALGPEFLVQFGPEFDIFPRAEETAVTS
ncbi:hypothetical protein L0Z72_14070 [candidate division KSB1 bacterium]|nr:hypothetical protein [candidate division KSB1 bacterium]